MESQTASLKRDHSQVDDDGTDYVDVRRTRRSSGYSFPPPPPTIDKHDRRRVNPEALASRLGPQIVAELDALILPGATDMPSWQARKHIQQTFNIDRRHIYDYYHAKGLRVVREDRAPSLSRSSQQDGAFDWVDDDTTRRPTRSTPLRRASTRTVASSEFQALHVTAAVSTRVSSPIKKVARTGKVAQKTKRIQASPSEPLLVHSPLNMPRWLSFNSPSAASDSFSPPRHSRTVSDLVALRSPLMSTMPTPRFFEHARQPSTSAHNCIPAMAGASDCEYILPPVDFSDFLRSPQIAAPVSTPILSLHDHELSREEREEHYTLFARALDSTDGLSELQGTYKSFMDSQAQEYFGPLHEAVNATRSSSPVSVHPTHDPTPAGDCGLFDATRQRDTRAVDFKKWLAPPLPPTLQEANSISPLSYDNMYGPSKHRGVSDFIASRCSSMSSSDSSDTSDSLNSISFDTIPPAMFGHVVREAFPRPAAPSPSYQLQPPPPAMQFYDVSGSMSMTQQYFDGQVPPQLQDPIFSAANSNEASFVPMQQPYVLSAAEDAYLPMEYHPGQHIVPPPTPVQMPALDHFMHYSQPMSYRGFDIHGNAAQEEPVHPAFQAPLESLAPAIPQFAAPAPVPAQDMLKQEWMDWDPQPFFMQSTQSA